MVIQSNKIPNTVLVLEVCFSSYFRQKILIMMPAYDKAAVNMSILNDICMFHRFICAALNTIECKCRKQWLKSAFSRDPHFYDKVFYSTVHVLFRVLIIFANSCWLKSFNGAREHQVELRVAGKYRWSSQQESSWAFQGVLASQDI